jgi:hypothetical protein
MGRGGCRSWQAWEGAQALQQLVWWMAPAQGPACHSPIRPILPCCNCCWCPPAEAASAAPNRLPHCRQLRAELLHRLDVQLPLLLAWRWLHLFVVHTGRLLLWKRYHGQQQKALQHKLLLPLPAAPLAASPSGAAAWRPWLLPWRPAGSRPIPPPAAAWPWLHQRWRQLLRASAAQCCLRRAVRQGAGPSLQWCTGQCLNA